MIRIDKSSLLIILILPLLSCTYRKPVNFWNGSDTTALYALSRNAQSGILPLQSTVKLEYSLSGLENLNDEYSLEISYWLENAGARGQAVIDLDGISWELPRDFSFLDNSVLPDIYRSTESLTIKYTIPVAGISLERLTLLWMPEITNTLRRGSSLNITRIELVPRWFGVSLDPENNTLRLSPFVYSRDSRLVMDIPAAFDHGNSAESAPEAAAESITASSLAPITSDPGRILRWPLHEWRITDYEIFRWGDFPSVLIFDFLDYGVQDRFLKRLAFFAEKTGFRGRLAADSEIRDLHGWNAHDYRSETLASFFDLAEKTNFPLLPEEKELETLLLYSGIIIRNSGGAIMPGEGGIISISRESQDYLRSLLMVHEGYHGIFYIDEDFRNFSLRRWNSLEPFARDFILAYFDLQTYDINNNYLVLKEFASFLLQQPVSQAAPYFGQTLPSRLENSPRHRTALPPKDETSGTWPMLAEAFRAEAETFSQYVNRRWNLAAGRVHQLQP